MWERLDLLTEGQVGFFLDTPFFCPPSMNNWLDISEIFLKGQYNNKKKRYILFFFFFCWKHNYVAGCRFLLECPHWADFSLDPSSVIKRLLCMLHSLLLVMLDASSNHQGTPYFFLSFRWIVKNEHSLQMCSLVIYMSLNKQTCPGL